MHGCPMHKMQDRGSNAMLDAGQRLVMRERAQHLGDMRRVEPLQHGQQPDATHEARGLGPSPVGLAQHARLLRRAVAALHLEGVLLCGGSDKARHVYVRLCVDGCHDAVQIHWPHERPIVLHRGTARVRPCPDAHVNSGVQRLLRRRV